MASEQGTPETVQLSLKRREDLTVAELRSLPWFKDHSDEAVAAIIETAKRFTKVVLYLYTMAKDKQSRKKVFDTTINPKKKAA